jgi:nucleolar MIF4G domain-containing protein 1
MYVQPKTKTLLEMLFVSLFQCVDKRSKSSSEHEQRVVEIFSKAKEVPQMVTGLRYVIPTTIKQSSLVTDPTEKKALRKNCRLAMDTLAILHMATATE